mmetsp:Transcript_7912/g.9069  ORF Transcript_7912/g.9069 Transcript_7912/m.9069 type:complete len:317 (-) Transcript_7912:150-1100(-)
MKAPLVIPNNAISTTIFYSVEVYSNEIVKSTLNNTILGTINTLFKAGLVGCEDTTSIVDDLSDSGIVSTVFASLEINNRNVEGSQSLCLDQMIPAKYSTSKCNSAVGEIDISYMSSKRRNLVSDEQYERIVSITKKILVEHSDYIIGDIESIDGLVYRDMTRDSRFGSTPRPEKGAFHRWKWSMPLFFLLASIIAFFAMFVLSNNRKIFRQAAYKEEVDDDLETLFSSREKKRSDERAMFPLGSLRRSNRNRNDAYDIGPIADGGTLEKNELIKMQRKQLLRQFPLPTLADNENNHIPITSNEMHEEAFETGYHDR